MIKFGRKLKAAAVIMRLVPRPLTGQGENMLCWKKSPLIPFLIAYLCLFFCLLPIRAEGAMLESSPSGSEAAVDRVAVERLETLGLSREEAEGRVTAYREAGISPAGMILRAGGSPPVDYDPPINNVALVFLICGIAVGAGIYAGSRD